MNTQAMSSTYHKMWCHLHNIFQQTWMRRLPHGACVTLVIIIVLWIREDLCLVSVSQAVNSVYGLIPDYSLLCM